MSIYSSGFRIRGLASCAAEYRHSSTRLRRNCIIAPDFCLKIGIIVVVRYTLFPRKDKQALVTAGGDKPGKGSRAIRESTAARVTVCVTLDQFRSTYKEGRFLVHRRENAIGPTAGAPNRWPSSLMSFEQAAARHMPCSKLSTKAASTLVKATSSTYFLGGAANKGQTPTIRP